MDRCGQRAAPALAVDGFGAWLFPPRGHQCGLKVRCVRPGDVAVPRSVRRRSPPETGFHAADRGDSSEPDEMPVGEGNVRCDVHSKRCFVRYRRDLKPVSRWPDLCCCHASSLLDTIGACQHRWADSMETQEGAIDYRAASARRRQPPGGSPKPAAPPHPTVQRRHIITSTRVTRRARLRGRR